MVDVSAKQATARQARAHAFVKMKPAVARKIRRLKLPKGDPLEVARIAGIAAAKRTAELIPLCHPLPLTHIDVAVELCQNGVRLTSSVRSTGPTGVEMEALTAVTVAGLTVYDMCKALDRGLELRQFVTDGVEDYVAKPFFVRELAARTKKVADRLHLEKLQTTARRPGVIEGRLEEMNVIDLFQSLEMGQKSCSLTLMHGKEKCQIFTENGQVYDAVLGNVVGDEAVYKAVDWHEGTFEIDFSGKSAQRRTTRSTQGLLMEALRLLDESHRDQVEG